MSENESNKDENYIQDFQEWQDHQYDRGYYTGGKISPFLLRPGKPKIAGLFGLVLGTIQLIIIIIWLIIMSYKDKFIFTSGSLFIIFLFIIFTTLQIMASIRRIKNSNLYIL